MRDAQSENANSPRKLAWLSVSKVTMDKVKHSEKQPLQMLGIDEGMQMDRMDSLIGYTSAIQLKIGRETAHPSHVTTDRGNAWSAAHKAPDHGLGSKLSRRATDCSIPVGLRFHIRENEDG
jgi:hypothetical protein